MIRTAYCTERPVIDHPLLVPVVTVHLDEPGRDALTAARRASERSGGPRDRWALCDQPPNWKGHTYGSEFGAPYGHYGMYPEVFELQAWMVEAFSELRFLGWGVPEFMPLDWEGHYEKLAFTGPRAKVAEQIQVNAENRAMAMRTAVVDAARKVWQVDSIEASNYEDRPGIHGDKDSNGWDYPPVGLSSIASPSVYVREDRGQLVEDAAQNALLTLSKAQEAGIEVVPWLSDPRYVGDGLPLDEDAPGAALWQIVNASEVERVILWGRRQGWAQLWACDQFGGIT